MTDIYSFTLAGSPSGIVSYGFEAGVSVHASADQIPADSLFVFLVNVATDLLLREVGLHTHVFYLDHDPVERAFLAQNYQLVYTDAPAGQTFGNWADIVISHLCACLQHPGWPPFDLHDIASVLLEVKSRRLQFRLVPFTDPHVAPPGEDGFNRLLAIAFASMDWFMPIHMSEELAKYEGLTQWLASGAVVRPGDQASMLFLGDKLTAAEPAITVKNPLIPEHLRAIY